MKRVRNLERYKLYRFITTARTYAISAILVLLASAVYYKTAPAGQDPWAVLFQNISAVIIASVALYFVWDLFGRRSFADEITAKISMSYDVNRAGIESFCNDFYDINHLDWQDHFKRASDVTVLFLYGTTWRKLCSAHIRAAAEKRKLRLRVILPDSTNQHLVGLLAEKLDKTPAEVVEKIDSAKEFFVRMHGSPTGLSVEVWFLPYVPVFTFYKIDETIILALNSNRPNDVSVPTFSINEDGQVGAFIRSEIVSLIEGDAPYARKVFPTPLEANLGAEGGVGPADAEPA